MAADEYLARIERFLADHQVDYEVERRRKCRAVVLMIDGKKHRVFFSASVSKTGDPRGPANVISQLRRTLGMAGPSSRVVLRERIRV
jgi:hypothetical protein